MQIFDDISSNDWFNDFTQFFLFTGIYVDSLQVVYLMAPKGQLISECLLGAIDFPKNQRKIWQISVLEYKKWSNHKTKAHYNDFDK